MKVILSFSLPWPILPAYHCIFSIHLFYGLVNHFGHCLRVILVDGEEELPQLQPTDEGSDENFFIGFINQEGLFIETGHV